MADPWDNDPVIRPRTAAQPQQAAAQNPWDSDPVVSQQSQAAPRTAARQAARPQVRFADDRDALIRTVIGEAQAEPPEGQAAVAAVILNRARQRGMTPSQVVLETNQFEPWGNPKTASRLAGISPNDPLYQSAAAQVDRALSGYDPTGGADHFYAPVAQQALGRNAPSWAVGEPTVIGGHNFYSLGGSTEDARMAAAQGVEAPVEVVDEFAADPVAEAPMAGPGSSEDNAIDLSADKLYQDQVDALKKGAWVRDKDGNVFQLPGDAFTSNSRASDEAQGGNILLRRPNLEDRLGGIASAYAEQIPWGDEALALGVGVASGEGYDAIRESQKTQADLLNQTERGARNVGGVAGFATGLLAPGGALINRGGSLAGRSARSLGVGAGYGAAYGSGAADDSYGSRLGGFVSGGVFGGITGGATPAVGQVANAATNFATRPLGRAANWVTGGNVQALQRFSPERQAETRISEALRNDNVSMDQLRAAVDEFRATGVTPTMIDVIQRVAPGGEAARLIRGSAMQQGPASVAAERYLERVSGNIQDQAIGMTRGLTPNDTRTADEAVAGLTRQRGEAATRDYAAPYAARVQPGPEVISALEGEAGMAAMRRARTAAAARQDTQQIEDIDSLMATVRVINQNPSLAGRIPAPEVSGATLDRIQRAMGGRARRMEMSPDTRDIASGLYQRQTGINSFLDTVEGLAPARQNYRNTTRQIEAVETGATGLNAAPDSFVFDDITRPAAAVGYRSALERGLGAGAEATTGTMNRVATSTNQTRNLRAVFGQDADRYQAGLVNLMDQLKNARFLASSSGSQTAPRMADQALAGIVALPSTIKAGFLGLIEKAARGATLTRRERNAIVELGVTEADLRDIAQIPFFSGFLTVPASQQAGAIAAP